MKSLAISALAGAAMASASSAGTPGLRKAYHPDEFRTIGRSAPTEKVSFTVQLKVDDAKVKALEKKVLEISDPDHPSYGQWMKGEEVNAMLAPAPEHRLAVKAWTKKMGAKCVDQPQALKCSASVKAVEKSLGTKLTAFAHTAKNDKVLHRVHPEQTWTFPADLQDKVHFISGLTDFPTVLRRGGSGVKAFKQGKEVSIPGAEAKKQGKKGKKVHDRHNKHHHASPRSLQGSPDGMIALETIRSFYNLDASVTGTMKTSVGAGEFQDDSSFLPSDVALYQGNNSVPLYAIPQNQIVGPFSDSQPDTESELDVDMIAGVGTGNSQWFWTEQDWMLEFVNHLSSLPDGSMPDVFSMSWGWWSGDQCSIDSTGGPCAGGNDANSYNYTLVVDQGFMAQTARGLTFLAASGDSGAHGRTDSLCFSNATRPIYPGSSPWITSVGGTQVVNQTANANPKSLMCKNYAASGTPCVGTGVEIVSSTFTGSGIVSGGGFSSVVPTPAWQASAVGGYLKSGALLPGAANANYKGRGYPDVSAFAHNVGIFQTGFAGSVDGTSCATPIVAALVSQLNAMRVTAGKAKLGFFNQVLYGKIAAASGAFTDVVKGDNRCTEDTLSWTDCPNCTGFGAVQGWDAATGFGTPKFDVWQKVVAALN